nr:ATP-grasp domain-containing protein [Streptomyces sp. HPF1205]
MSSRPTVLVTTLGDFRYRGFCLQQVAAAYNVVVIDSVSPTPEHAPYVADFEIADPHDEQALLAAGRELAGRHDLAGVMTWNEWVLVPTARLAEQLGLPSNTPEVMLACRNKATARARFARAGVPSAASMKAASLLEAAMAADAVGGYPVVLKPAAYAASVGVIHVERPEDLPAAFGFATAGASQAMESTAVLVEEYLDGPEVSVETVTFAGTTLPVAVTRKSLGALPYFEETGHAVAAGDPLLAEAGPVAVAAVRALGVEHGVCHVEIRLTSRGPRVVEVNARIGGDLIGHLVDLATGIQLARAAADIACWCAPDLTPTRHQAAAVRIRYPETSGTVTARGLTRGFAAGTPWLDRATWLCDVGDRLLLPPEGSSFTARAGLVVVTAPTAALAERRAQRAYDHMTVDMDPATDEPQATTA